jgi:hypothetical protein
VLGEGWVRGRGRRSGIVRREGEREMALGRYGTMIYGGKTACGTVVGRATDEGLTEFANL